MILFFLRLFIVNNLFRVNLGIILSRLFVSNVLFILFITLLVLNNLMQFYQDIIYLSGFYWGLDLTVISTVSTMKLISVSSTSLSLIEVYYYPFIYVFLVVTVLSIMFCLSYNKDELMSFMFYCQLILIAGYTLFFTDSIILFFLAYEMLLVPSFFILYKFAKTRRCVEAAYLMFF
jgi:formate hydrogenlyase subunit 3/multisubunit Na+/H+ antiporter MnhD subunit